LATPQPSLTLIRHGDTEWSLSGRHTGWTDIPLVESGRRQAAQLGGRLRGRSFSLVLSSPLSRALETCRLAGLGDAVATAVATDPDLREWNYGDLEGLTSDEIRRSMPAWTIWSGPVPGGESAEEVGRRADRVIARALGAGGDVAIFAHGHLLRVLAARWLGLGAVDGALFELGTATLSRLGWERERRVIELWNEPPTPD
jgi:broad specificity phosphatase PhoE